MVHKAESDTANVCPKCGSGCIDMPEDTYVCLDCGNEWQS